MINKHPALWNWLQAMHRLPALAGYQRMYSKGHPEVSAHLAVEPEVGKPLRGSACSQLLFWMGAVGMVALAPITVAAIAMVMLASNPKPNSGGSMAAKQLRKDGLQLKKD